MTESNTSVRAAMYVRAATEKGRAKSLKLQDKHIREYAAISGTEIVREYSDVGASSAPHRRGLFQLEAEARLGVYDVLIVQSPNRLFRNKRQLQDFIECLEGLGVTVRLVEGQVQDE